MFSDTVEYAMRASVHLAYSAPNACTTEEIADATKVPRAYLSKVLQGLSRAGIVRSQRGIGGGMTLARDPARLTLLEVVSAVAPLRRIRECPLGISSHGSTLCALHRRLDEAYAGFEAALRDTTLADLLNDNSEIKPLCDTGAAAVRREGVPV